MSLIKIIQEKLDSRLAAGNDNAFYILDTEDVKHKYRAWVNNIPRVQPFFAVKCNDHTTIMEVLRDEGAGFDCASKREIKKALSLGVDPSRIIYSHTVKQISHLKFAAEKNVRKVTFDCEQELLKIKQFHPLAEVVLRIKFDSDTSVVCLGLKFGCDRFVEAPKLIQQCRELNLNLIGVSFHVGSGTEESEVFGKAIEAVKDVFEVAKVHGYDLNFVDIGGGFMGNEPDIIIKYAKPINSAIENFFSSPGYSIISEPGRYFVESALTRVIQIVLKKTTPDGQIHYYVNDGIYMSFLINYIYNGEYLTLGEVEVIRKQNAESDTSAKKIRATIWGTSCNSKDKIFDNFLMPEVETGDWLVFRGMGAYTTSVSTTFNGFAIEDDDVIVL